MFNIIFRCVTNGHGAFNFRVRTISKTHQYSVGGVRGASHIIHFPDDVVYFVDVIVLSQMEDAFRLGRVADDADASFVLADLQTTDDIHDELFDGVPVLSANAEGRVDHEDDVSLAVPVDCE